MELKISGYLPMVILDSQKVGNLFSLIYYAKKILHTTLGYLFYSMTTLRMMGFAVFT